MSKAQKEMKIAIDNSNDQNIITELRKKRNHTLKEIKKKQKEVQEKEINSITDELLQAQNDNQYFKALKLIRNPANKNKNIVHDKEGKTVVNNDEQYNIVKEHFQSQFYDPQIKEIEPFIGEPKPLGNKITQEEVRKAVKRTINNKATGDDGLQLELIKYGPDILFEEISNNLNHVLENHSMEINFGLSILLPMPKPNKPQGPTKNLRPLNLLEAIRKILSLVTLNRIKSKVENYLSKSQSAYRENRSTSDIIWSHRFIIAKSMLYQGHVVKVTGLDMSSAFDTIDREELLTVLKSFINNDELRMCRLLLSKTTMKLRFGSHEEEIFKSNKGSQQGDAISGVFFNVAFENALKDLRAEIRKVNTYSEHDYSKKSNLPEEMVYADDGDFPNEDTQLDLKIQQLAKPILGKHNLVVNDDKWEKTTIKRSNKKEDEEEWRNTKKLGSLLGDYQDMKRRILLSNIAMQSVEKIWPMKKVNIKLKLKIYQAIVKSVLTYNMCTWGLTCSQEEELDRAHRKQLRRIWNDPYKKNNELYRDSNEIPISTSMKRARWRKLGHILRLDDEVPGQKAMRYYFDKPINSKRFAGRPRITLPVKIDNDIKKCADTNNIGVTKFTSNEDLDTLKEIAYDRKRWKKLSNLICNMAEDDE